MLFRAFCALADGTASVVNSSLKHFADEYEEHVGWAAARWAAHEPAEVARVSADLVTLTIDGKEVTVPTGTLIIRAAEQVGVEIPRFCDHPYLEPAGACRQCYVQVEGQRKLATSCTTPVAPGMVVSHAEHERRRRARRRRRTWSSCCSTTRSTARSATAAGSARCRTRRWRSARARAGSSRPSGLPEADPDVAAGDLDRERCVLCARCTRFCDEISGDRFIELFARGAGEQVSIAAGEDFRSPFAGNTVQICPVGALTATPYRFVARPFDLDERRQRVRALQRRVQRPGRRPPRRGRARPRARRTAR